MVVCGSTVVEGSFEIAHMIAKEKNPQH